MQVGVGHDGLALLELHLHLREEGHEAGEWYMGWLLVSWVAGQKVWQARLYSLIKSGRVVTLLAALAARLRRRPIEFAVKTVAVRGRGGRVAAPGRK